MNKSDLRNEARDMVYHRENNYWNTRQEEAEEKEANGLTKKQNKLLKDSENCEKNIKKQYAILMKNFEEYKRKDLNNLPDTSGSKKWFNHIGIRGEYVPVDEITDELEDLEEEWGIDYGDYLHDLK